MEQIRTKRFLKNDYKGYGRPKDLHVSIEQDEDKTTISFGDCKIDLREIGLYLEKVKDESRWFN